MPESDSPSTAENLSWLDETDPPKREFPKVERESECMKVYRQHMANLRLQRQAANKTAA